MSNSSQNEEPKESAPTSNGLKKKAARLGLVLTTAFGVAQLASINQGSNSLPARKEYIASLNHDLDTVQSRLAIAHELQSRPADIPQFLIDLAEGKYADFQGNGQIFVEFSAISPANEKTSDFPQPTFFSLAVTRYGKPEDCFGLQAVYADGSNSYQSFPLSDPTKFKLFLGQLLPKSTPSASELSLFSRSTFRKISSGDLHQVLGEGRLSISELTGKVYQQLGDGDIFIDRNWAIFNNLSVSKNDNKYYSKLFSAANTTDKPLTYQILPNADEGIFPSAVVEELTINLPVGKPQGSSIPDRASLNLIKISSPNLHDGRPQYIFHGINGRFVEIQSQRSRVLFEKAKLIHEFQSSK